MKRIILALLFLLPVLAQAQIITTIAGTTGYHGYAGDGGPATDALLNWPNGVTVDNAGRVYIADFWNCRIRMVNPVDGTISTVAGNGSIARTGDGGPATAAGINFPKCVTFDGLGNMYIACDSITSPYTMFYSYSGANIRKIDAAGNIMTIAGIGAIGFNGDGIPAIGAGFKDIMAIVADSLGNIYVADVRSRIEKINAAGIINTIAGNGTWGKTDDGGPATAAIITVPEGLAKDQQGNIYFSDASDNRIRKIDTAGILSTVVGDSTWGYSGDGGPASAAHINFPTGLAIDRNGNFFFSDYGNYMVRKIDVTGIITTVAGSGIYGYSGDGGPADSAEIGGVTSVAVDSAGDLYLADVDNTDVRMVCAQCAGESVPAIQHSGPQLVIAPNPATTELFISATVTITTVTISNMLGQTVYKHVYNTTDAQVDVAALPMGVYLIRVNGSVMRRFVKE